MPAATLSYVIDQSVLNFASHCFILSNRSSSIAACRCFARLQDYANGEVYVNNQSATINGVPVDGRAAARLGAGKPPRFAVTRPEVQIRTDQFTMGNLE